MPGRPGSARVEQVAEPEPTGTSLVVQAIALGVCGTDREIAAGQYGWAPDGADRLVLGHESLGRVRSASTGNGFAPGDLVAGVVRRPDPVPCGACAHGEFDMCRNGRYTERGIKQAHGYGSEVWVVEPEYAVKVDAALGDLGVLIEPTSVVAKAWEQVERIGARSWFEPQRVLVTGAGPIGLLAAMLGAQRKLDVHVLDVVNGGSKPMAVKALDATYHVADVRETVQRIQPDIVIEATGVPSVIVGAASATPPYGIVCLTGVSSAGRTVSVDVGSFNRDTVLENDVIVGSVNANVRHYQAAAAALKSADQDWLARLITRRLPLGRFGEALEPQPDDIKVVLSFDTLS